MAWKKTEREDMEKKLGILKGGQITPNMIDRAKILAKKYFDDKGYKNADIEINQKDDLSHKNQVILDVVIDKKEKMKVRNIFIEGNNQLKASRIKGGLFKKGAFAKTHEAGKLSTFLKSKKFTPERWKEDKEKLIEKYNELGYRDATILADSVWNNDPKHVNIWIKVSEGQKYYIRKIHWVGNTVYNSDYLQRVLGMNLATSTTRSCSTNDSRMMRTPSVTSITTTAMCSPASTPWNRISKATPSTWRCVCRKVRRPTCRMCASMATTGSTRTSCDGSSVPSRRPLLQGGYHAILP